MKIIVEKRNNRYFAIIKNINSNIPKKIIITKSWDSTFLKEKILNYDILNNELNIVVLDRVKFDDNYFLI